MPNVLVIVGHPDSTSFTYALASAYAEAASRGGAQVTRLNLAELRFDPWLQQAYKEEQALEPDLLAARQAILDAQHIAWFFPMWWGAPPALVKAFIERVFTPGFAFRYRGRNEVPLKLLKGRSGRFVTSMDSPGAWYTLMLRRSLHASFGTGTLSFVGIAPVWYTTLYEARFKSEAQRTRALEQVTRAAGDDVRAVQRRIGRQAAKGALPSGELAAR